MSIIGSNILAGASGQAGYNLNNSLRFRSSASAYLNRTFATPTSQSIFTFSCWIKRGKLSIGQTIFGVSTTNFDGIYFETTDQINIYSSGVPQITTTAVYRDPSAWYHIVLSHSGTSNTLYINGVSVGTGTFAFNIFNTGNSHIIGQNSSLNYYDGYLAEVNFIDGQALTPSSFGETSTTTGSWIPKKYTNTYGTNGFYLNFSDIATTSGSNAGLGKDFSGNANYWTTNNISVTAGITYDAMIDVCTNTSATVANYAVWNPLLPINSVSEATNVLDGNLQLKGYNIAYNTWAVGTIEVSSGKWYYEFTNNNAADWQRIGIISTSGKLNPTDASAYYMYYSLNGNKISTGGTSAAYGATWTTGDIIGVALDLDNDKIFFSKNGVWQASGDPVAGTNAAYTGLTGAFAPASLIGSAVANSAFVNFGQRPFAYTPPTGFVRLNTYNLPDSTIVQGNKVMDATLYTGTGASLSVTNAGSFKPDLVWVKGRSGATDHALYDSVRGTTIDLVSNSTAAETTQTTGLTAFGTGGFTVGALAKLNTSAATYVGWQWQAGQGSSSSNTSGSITSTVSVNATAGFSVVTYTGNGSTGATFGHGLGVAPKMVVIKKRSTGTAGNWIVYHTSTGVNQYLSLNSSAAAGSTTPTWGVSSTLITLQQPFNDYNTSTGPYVAYCWAEIAGFSKFGSYTGNGSTDGPFVYLGFRPKWLLVKQSSSAGNAWQLIDSSRNTYNKADNALFPNSTAVEGTGNATFDFLSNGVKIRTADGTINTSSSTYIYMAFAENPFKNANAR